MSDDDTAPRVFLSHASEDKERFVIPFATRLRSVGIDVWVDQWELRPGDSLVQRIFDEGIASADALIVVLSHASVVKPWVREELDAGVVRRITSGGSTRLVPVLLDEDVQVPAPLRHLLWESVPNSGIDQVGERIANDLLGLSTKPALGPRPTYQQTPIRWTTESADEVIFALIVDLLRSHDGPGWMLFSNEVQERAHERGIEAERFRESMLALIDQGLVNAETMAGGVRWLIRPFSDRIWLDLERDSGVNLDTARQELLASIVNGDQDHATFDPSDIDISWNTMGALLRQFQAKGLMRVNSIADGRYTVHGVSPLAKRTLRQLNS